ncbi:MAG TPA: TadE family protein [Rhodocyclaceae bacterium]|nr:TadE family protein [Rhodocyclaceae bacterium]
MLKRGYRPGTTGQGGAAAVEFAFVLAIMILLVSGLFEFGRVFWFYDALAKSTRDSARMLSMTEVTGLSAGVSQAQSMVVTAASQARLSGVTAAKVSVRCDDDYSDTTDYACTDSRFTVANPPVRVIVGITGYSITVGGILPMVRQDGSTWAPFSLGLSPKTTMPYMK